jgi:DNA-directed RNA polymerase subunit K/omega
MNMEDLIEVTDSELLNDNTTTPDVDVDVDKDPEKDPEQEEEENDPEEELDDTTVNESESESENESDIDDIEDEESFLYGGAEPGAEPGTDKGADKGTKASKKKAMTTVVQQEESSDSSDDSEDEEDYLQKFNQQMRDDLILNFHPESKSHNYEEIKQLTKVTRNKNGVIVDELHKTIPILTKYEKTRILGQRAKQIECGAIPLVQVPPNIIDSYLIAKLELAQQKIPFIIRRPLPNGGMEYWYVSDLENL